MFVFCDQMKAILLFGAFNVWNSEEVVKEEGKGELEWCSELAKGCLLPEDGAEFYCILTDDILQKGLLMTAKWKLMTL